MESKLFLILFGLSIVLFLPNFAEAGCLISCTYCSDTTDCEWTDHYNCVERLGIIGSIENPGPHICDSGWQGASCPSGYNCSDSGGKCKNNAFPTGNDGQSCVARDSCVSGISCNYWSKTGVWDAYESQCVTCNGKKEDRILGDTFSVYAGCGDEDGGVGNGKCESACGADLLCDEKNPWDWVGNGVCNDNCIWCPAAVCGGYNGHYSDFPNWKFYNVDGGYPFDGCAYADIKNCDDYDVCADGYWKDYGCSDGLCVIQSSTCTETCCVAYYGAGAYCSGGVCYPPECPDAVCGGYNGHYSDFPNWRFYNLDGDYPFNGCAYADIKNCDDDDGCSPYGTGCEERNYSCSDGSCTYSYSNRHTDECVSYGTSGCAERDWYCSGSSCTYTDSNQNDDRCVGDDWYDYYCSGSSCIYTISYDDPDCVICTPHHHVGCWNNDVYWYDSCNTLEDKYQECGDDYYQCCNGSCGYQLVDRGCSAGSCYSLPGSCTDCGYYTCSAGSCTANCSQTCGAPCDEGSDCPSGTCQANCTCLVVTECTAGGSCSNPGEVCCAGGVLYECQEVIAFGPSEEVYVYEEYKNQSSSASKITSLGAASIVDTAKEFWQNIKNFILKK